MLTGALIWSKEYDGTVSPTGVALDSAGNSLVTGAFTGSVNFGKGTLTSAGGYDLFVAKFDPTGTAIWSARFGDSSNQGGSGIAVDSSGNVLVSGFFAGTVNLGGGPLVSSGWGDIFLAKFDASGNYVWADAFSDAQTLGEPTVALDASGQPILSGQFYGTLNLGKGAMVSQSGNGSIYLAKFDTSGKTLWSKALRAIGDAGSSAAEPTPVVVDSAGEIHLGGFFTGSLDLGGGHTLRGEGDVFCAAFDASGGVVWDRSYGDLQLQEASGLSVDRSGNTFVTGTFQGTLDFGSGSLSASNGAIFLAKLDSSGTGVWSKQFGDSTSTVSVPQSVVVDAWGNPTIAGGFFGSADFGHGTLLGSPGGGAFPYVAAFDAVGAPGWQYGGDNEGILSALVTDNTSDVLLVGQAGTSPLHLAGVAFSKPSAILLKLAP